MTTRYSCVLALILFAGGVSSAGRLQAVSSKAKVTHRARALQPGEVVLIGLESPQALNQLEAEAFGRVFSFYADANGRTWSGLVGIDLETKAGRYKVSFRGSQMNGAAVHFDHPLVVTSKTFPTRRLTVEEKFVTPPAEVRERIRKESERVQATFTVVSPQRLWRGTFRAPVPGTVISEFGKRNVINGEPRSPHAGTDFRAASGTPIRAPNAGVVVLADDLYFSGNTIIIDHGLGLFSYFAHLSAFSAREGTRIRAGEIIGKVGATGRVTGPHLHWSVRLGGSRVDPVSLLQIFKDNQPPPPPKTTHFGVRPRNV